MVLLAIKVSHDKGLNNEPIKEVTYNEYLDKIKSSNYTIVLLEKDNCGYCKDYKPSVRMVLNEFGKEAISINVNQLKEDDKRALHDSISVLKNKYDDDGKIIIGTPTTILFKDGLEVDVIQGDIGDKGLREFLVKNGVVDNENL